MHVSNDHLVRGWRDASRILTGPGAPDYIITLSLGPGWTEAAASLNILDRIAKNRGAENPSAAAAMLIPKSVMAANGTAAQKISAGLAHLGRGRRAGLRYSGWTHTYFERLVGQYADHAGRVQRIGEPRLLNIIQKANSWGTNAGAALNAHIWSAADTLRTRGSPCLQYVQFRLLDNSGLELAAVYRSHDYFNKSLGNFIGLQRLANFVADSTGRNFRRLHVVSFNSHIGSRGSKGRLEQYSANAVE